MMLLNSKSIHRDNLNGYVKAMEQAICHKEMNDNECKAQGYLACLLHTGLIGAGQHTQAYALLKQTREQWRAQRVLKVQGRNTAASLGNRDKNT